MHRNLIDAIGRGVIRCFGDANQLPPIEEDRTVVGLSPFQRLLKEFPSVILETIYRQGEGSLIVSNGAKILKGRQVNPDPGSFVLKLDDKPITVLSKILANLKDKGRPLFDGQDHQVITPQRIGKFGSIVLNKLMAQLYWPGGESVEIERWPWELKKDKTLERFQTIGVGQKVIMTKNIYDLRPMMEDRFEGKHEDGSWYGFHPPGPHEEMFNGEAGTVVSVDGGCIGVDLGDRIVSVPPVLEYFNTSGDVRAHDPRRWLELGYAITTHKAQGSEYDGVIYFISRSAATNQCRANYYTAVTRARKQVVVVADRASVSGFSLREKSGW
jgi:exodeoxyribonuclease V alpha subunit